MMTLDEKAAYAAQNADSAKEYALYLAFENALIRSGTENVTLEALAGLSDIQAAFTAFYPVVEQAIVDASPAYYPYALNTLAAVVETELEKTLADNGYPVDATVTAEDIQAIVNAADDAGRYNAAQVIAENAMLQIYISTVINKAVDGIDQVFAAVMETLQNNYSLSVSLSSVDYYNFLHESSLTELDTAAKKQLLDDWAVDAYNENEEYSTEFENLVNYFNSALPLSIGSTVKDGILDTAEGEQGMAMISQYALQLQSDEAIRAGMSETPELATILDLIATAISGNEALTSENVGLLAYLLALPQTMSDTLYNDSNNLFFLLSL